MEHSTVDNMRDETASGVYEACCFLNVFYTRCLLIPRAISW